MYHFVVLEGTQYSLSLEMHIDTDVWGLLRFVYSSNCIAIILLLSSSLFIVTGENGGVLTKDASKESYEISSTLEVHDPIIIHSNQGFELLEFTGEGTATDPYIIESLNITAMDRCISISDTTAYFIIRNCFLYSTHGYYGIALSFENVQNGIAEDCTIRSFGSWGAAGSDVIAMGTGTKIMNSRNCTIRHCAIETNGEGFTIEDCTYLFFFDNNIRDNQMGGQISNTNYTVFRDNQFLNNWEDIWTIYLDSCVFQNQTFRAKNWAILIRYSTNLTISDNTFLHCGIRFWGVRNTDDLNHTITGNTVDDLVLSYYYHESNKTINGAGQGQIVLGDCRNITLVDFYAENVSCGIQLISCINCKVTNSSIVDGSREGIYVLDSVNCVIQNSNLCNNLYAIRIDPSSSIRVLGNSLQFNFHGISIYGTKDMFIKSNTILNSSHAAITASDHSSSITIEDNHIVNSSFGIIIDYSQTGVIRRNIVYDCTSVGITLGYETFAFHVFENLIGWNKLNARDNGGANVWDDGISRGNNWTDYCGSGAYQIPGQNGAAFDRYPSFLYDPTRPNATTPICGYAIAAMIFGASIIGLVIAVPILFYIYKRSKK